MTIEALSAEWTKASGLQHRIQVEIRRRESEPTRKEEVESDDATMVIKSEAVAVGILLELLENMPTEFLIHFNDKFKRILDNNLAKNQVRSEARD